MRNISLMTHRPTCKKFMSYVCDYIFIANIIILGAFFVHSNLSILFLTAKSKMMTQWSQSSRGAIKWKLMKIRCPSRETSESDQKMALYHDTDTCASRDMLVYASLAAQVVSGRFIFRIFVASISPNECNSLPVGPCRYILFNQGETKRDF